MQSFPLYFRYYKLTEYDAILSTKSAMTNNNLEDKIVHGHNQAQIEIALRTPYTYRPLNDSNEEIRVVKFTAGNGVSNKIECDIEHCLLSEEGDSYEAISYVWGEPIRNHDILCDNGTSHLKVTSNLRDVIERLASVPENDGHQRYWVDSICINQDNSAERDSQVKRMAKIYGYSKRVHVFLGTVEPGRHPATSSWFSRRWVSKISLVRSDETSVTLTYPTQVIQEYLNARMTSIHYNRQDTWYRHDDWYSFWQDDHRASDDKPESRGIDDSRFHILTMMYGFNDRQCSDDWDRLFALLGGSCDVVITDTRPTLSTANEPTIYYMPTYTTTTEQVYLEFAQAALTSTSAYNLLSCAGAFRHIHNEVPRTMPSWVPDWRCTPPLYLPTIDGDGWLDVEPFTACASEFTNGMSSRHKPSVVVNEDGRSITLEAIPFGTVKRISERQLSYGFSRVINIDDGYQALAPESIAIGDQVIIPIGAPTPLVLRQDESANYTLVSNCWVTEDPTSVLPPAQDWIMTAYCGGEVNIASIRDYRIL